VYGDEVAEVYDAVYVDGQGKDYAAEAAALVALVRQHVPAAASLLDVACGTGAHLAHLRHAFSRVAGVELSGAMRRLAAERLPGVPVHAGDMRMFRLNETFDVVTCLFSSIGYVEGVDELGQVVARMADHLNPGGMLVIEPWFTPEQWREGHVSHTVTRSGERTIVRMGHSTRSGQLSRMRMHYLVGEPGMGVRHFEQAHVMTLFTTDEYAQAVAAAGLVAVEHDESWSSDRSLLVALA
jgi:SAM-dependent methyltransferase